MALRSPLTFHSISSIQARESSKLSWPSSTQKVKGQGCKVIAIVCLTDVVLNELVKNVFGKCSERSLVGKAEFVGKHEGSVHYTTVDKLDGGGGQGRGREEEKIGRGEKRRGGRGRGRGGGRREGRRREREGGGAEKGSRGETVTRQERSA